MVVKYFSWIKEHIGKSEEQIDLPSNITNVNQLINYLNEIDKKYNIIFEKKELIKIAINKTYSTFDNTAPHIIIWSSGFRNSKAYFQSEPLSVNTYGVREWVNLYPFVESIRIPEVLDYYKSAGLSSKKYFRNKNYALRSLILNLIKIYFYKNIKGSSYINIRKHIMSNLFYPGVYYGFFYFSFITVNLISIQETLIGLLIIFTTPKLGLVMYLFPT